MQPETGTLHWVAERPNQAGKGLGSLVSIAVLNDLARRGNVGARLRTDDGRLPAIQTFLKLGFEPDGATAARAERWQSVRENDLITSALRFERGFAVVPNAPGLGVQLDRAALTKYTAGAAIEVVA